MSTKILQTGELPQGGAEAPFAIVPDRRDLFMKRAERFRTLAGGGEFAHPQAEWLLFLAGLSTAQHAALREVVDCEPPAPDVRQQAREHCMPPLAIASLERDPAWQKALQAIIADLSGGDFPDSSHGDSLNSQKNRPNATFATLATLERLAKTSSGGLETLAGKVLEHELADDADRAASVFVAAALQVYWTALAAQFDPAALVRLDNKGLCPCCGSLPVASVVRVGGATENLRYLHCSLCNTEWNLVRVTCASCADNTGIEYHSLHGHYPAMRAETCEACKGYLKILYLEKDPQADPVADDLATLALDLLIDEAGYERAGPNLFLLSGS